MKRIFEIDNKNEIKLEVDGFDCAPILIGTEQSDGITSLEKLSEFKGCNLQVKSVNVKKSDSEILEVKTYYTVANAKEKKYNNDIVNNFERAEKTKMIVEVCLGEKEYKRYIQLEYPSTLNFVEISKRVHLDIFKILSNSKEKDLSEETIDLIMYDKDGFEKKYNATPSSILSFILSVRIIDTTNNKLTETVSKKARNAFQLMKDDGKSKMEAISNIKESVINMLSLKRA